MSDHAPDMVLNHKAWVAVGIGEWQAALDHLKAMDQIGHHVPPSTTNRIRTELVTLCRRWVQLSDRSVYFTLTDIDQIVTEARAWATEHEAELPDFDKEGSGT